MKKVRTSRRKTTFHAYSAQEEQKRSEEERKIINRLRKRAVCYFFGVMILTAILALLANLYAPIAGMILVIMLSAALYYQTGGNRYGKEYALTLKDQMLRGLLEQEFSNVRVRYSEGFPIEYAREKDLIYLSDRHYRSNDYISGTYQEIAFRRADVYAALTMLRDGTHKKHTVVFEGRWMVFFLPKKRHGDIQIFQREFDAVHRLDAPDRENGKNYVLFETGEEDFDKAFVVCTSDVNYAKEFLTPTMCRKIISYCNLSDGKVMLCYMENELHVLVDNDENVMEPDPYSKDSRTQLERELYHEIAIIKESIERLV